MDKASRLQLRRMLLQDDNDTVPIHVKTLTYSGLSDNPSPIATFIGLPFYQRSRRLVVSITGKHSSPAR